MVLCLAKNYRVLRIIVLKAKNTYDLFMSNDLASRAEFQARLMLPLATLILGFLAIPLSYSSPRKGRYDKIFLGALVYFVYFIAMSVTKKMFLLELTPSFLGIMVVTFNHDWDNS